MFDVLIRGVHLADLHTGMLNRKVACCFLQRFQGKCIRMDFVERRPYEKHNPNKVRSKRISASPQLVANRVYIGNLPWRVDSTTLEQLFSIHGTVQEAQVMKDRINGRSRGYGFVVMSSAAEMEKAIAALDGCVSASIQHFCNDNSGFILGNLIFIFFKIYRKLKADL